MNGGVTNASDNYSRQNAALEFDGVDGEVNIGGGLDELVGTVSLWFDSSIELSVSSGYYELAGFGSVKNSILLGGSVSGNYGNEFITFYNNNGGEVSFYNETDGNIALGWHHLVAVWETDRYNFYLDGVRKNASIFGTPSQISAVGLNLGDVTGISGNFFNGTIDEVLIYNRALTTSEITDLYNRGLLRHNVTSATEFNWTSVSDGSYDYFVVANDSNGNTNSTELRNITLDTTKSTISFITPTQADGGSVNEDYVLINTTITESTDTSAWIDWDKSLVGYWNFDNYNSTGLFDNSTHCYDNKTEILTEQGWKYFYDLDKTEEVATLNQGTGELEWQLPMEWQEFNYDREMYKIVLEDGNGLLVSERHRVYANKNDKLNIYEKENKDATNVASMVKHKVFTDYDKFSNNNYINFSVNNDFAEDAPVALMVTHQSNKLALHGHPGSNPGWGASALYDFELQPITEVYSDFENGNEIIK